MLTKRDKFILKVIGIILLGFILLIVKGVYEHEDKIVYTNKYVISN